jgi:spermidine synthase
VSAGTSPLVADDSATGLAVPGETSDPEVLDRVTTPRGELVLRRVDGAFEVISNGVFLMDSRDGRSERALVRAAVARHPEAHRLLVGGLGVGFSVLEAVATPGLTDIDVVEIEPVLVGWHETHLRDLTGSALRDPRVTVLQRDVRDHLRASPGRYDIVCLDVDNGPDWTVIEDNAALYSAAGLATCVEALAPGGVLAVWSAHRSPAYEQLVRETLGELEVVEVEVARGEPDVVYLAGLR